MNKTIFDDLHIGDLFKYEDRICIRINGYRPNSLDLNTGCVCTVKDDTPITYLEKVVIDRQKGELS